MKYLQSDDRLQKYKACFVDRHYHRNTNANLMGKISHFNSLFGGLPLGVASSKNIQLLSSMGRIFGENFKSISQSVLKLSRQKKTSRTYGWMDGWMDGHS